MCSAKSAGTEYAIVRMDASPLSECLKVANSVSSNSPACLTVALNPSQSPAGLILVAVILFSLSQSVTALTVASVGATKASTCEVYRLQ